MGRVAAYSYRQSRRDDLARTNDLLVETLVVEENVPIDVVFLQRLLQGRRGLQGEPREACRGLGGWRWSRNGKELVQSLFVCGLLGHRVCGLRETMVVVVVQEWGKGGPIAFQGSYTLML